MSKTEGEKIAVLEANMQNIEAALKEIKIDIKDIKSTLAMIPVQELDTRLKRLENQSNFWKFVSPTLAAICGSVLTFLIISYLNNIR